MKIVATILRVGSRPEILDWRVLAPLFTTHKIAWQVFNSDEPPSRANATANLLAALAWAESQVADWHLFLEDDQLVFPDFVRELPALIELADRYDRDGLILHNRWMHSKPQRFVDGYVVSEPKERIAGSHGLLYRHTRTAPWRRRATEAPAVPIDLTFSAACPPERTWQIIAPAMMQHTGIVSTLHRYPGNRHLATASVSRETLDALKANHGRG